MTVERGFSGVRIADFLAHHWPETLRRAWRTALGDGSITVNGENVHPHQRLAMGDVIEVQVDPATLSAHVPAPGEGLEPVLLFEDERLLIVDKPAGMPTTPDRGGKYLGVHGWLKKHRPEQDLRIAHRLDAGTSGCLVLAKGLEVARFLDRSFRVGAIHKEYRALVDGVVRRPLDLRGSLGPDRRRPGRVRVVADGSKGARTAHTLVELEQAYWRHSLLAVFPKTGRSHQIRVHLAHAGHPIVGDPDYGSGRQLMLSQFKSDYKQRRGQVERPLLRRMFLHALRIQVPAPDGSEPVSAEAPMPKSLATVLHKLRRFSPGRETLG